jgi:hypothetical protein
MARRYSTLGDVIDQLKTNNDSSIDTTQAVDSLHNTVSSYFVKKSKIDLEASREKSTAKAKKAAGSGITEQVKKADSGLLGSLKGLKGIGFLGGLALLAKVVGGGVIKLLAALGPAGVGLGAFFLGLSSAEAIIQKFASKDAGEGIKKLLQNLAAGLSAFGKKEFLALGTVLAAGMIFPKSTVKGLGAVGLGMAAFFTSLAGADALMSMMGGDQGENLKKLLENLAGGLSAFGSKEFAALGAAMASGALLGLFPGGAQAAALGIASIGVGIGAFITSLAGFSKLGAVLGVDGSAFKTLVTNIAGGLTALNKVEAEGLLSKVGAIAGIGPALLSAMVGSGGVQLVDNLIDGAKKIVNFLFGTDLKDQKTTRANMIQSMVDAMEPLKSIDISVADNLDRLSGALKKFMDNLNDLGKISLKGFEKSVKDMIAGMGIQLDLIDKMANGGKVGSGYFDGIPEVDFGKGFLSPDLKVDDLVKQMNKVNMILGKTNTIQPANQLQKNNIDPVDTGKSTAPSGTTNNNSNSSNNNVVVAPTNNQTISNKNTTNALISNGPAVDIQDQLVVGFGT